MGFNNSKVVFTCGLYNISFLCLPVRFLEGYEPFALDAKFKLMCINKQLKIYGISIKCGFMIKKAIKLNIILNYLPI